MEDRSKKIEPKPQLHQSQLQTLWRCGIQFERRYIKGQKIAPGIASIVGTSVHRVASVNLQHKVERKTLLPIEAVTEIARDSLVKSWNENGVRLLPEEQADGLKKVRGQAIDRTILLSTLHATELAPKLKPAKDGIDKKFVITVKDSKFDLAGETDLEEKDTTLRDLKTWSHNRGQAEADRSEQLSFYSLNQKVQTGKLPKKVAIDALVDYKQGPKVVTLESQRDMKDIEVSLARFRNAVKIIEKGAFTPASQSDWWCSRRFCGFSDTCEYFRGRETVSVKGLKKGVGTNGK